MATKLNAKSLARESAYLPSPTKPAMALIGAMINSKAIKKAHLAMRLKSNWLCFGPLYCSILKTPVSSIPALCGCAA